MYYFFLFFIVLVSCSSTKPTQTTQPLPKVPSISDILPSKVDGIHENRIIPTSYTSLSTTATKQALQQSLTFEYYTHYQNDSILTIELGAFNEKNQYVLNLSKRNDAIEIFKNPFTTINKEIIGINQSNITSFSVSEIQDTAAKKWTVILDYSASMVDNIKKLESSVLEFVKTLPSKDRVKIVKFSKEHFESRYVKPNQVEKVLQQNPFEQIASSTSLYYAISMSMPEDAKNSIVVVFTDGDDNTSMPVSFSKEQGEWDPNVVIDMYKKEKVPIHVIGFMHSIKREHLRIISQSTGGMFLYLKQEDENCMKNAFSSIQRAITNKYFINISTKEKIKEKTIPKPEEISALVCLFRNDEINQSALDTTLANGLAKFMKRNPEYYAYIEGHASTPGTEERNEFLSKGRAHLISNYLISKGIHTSRIYTTWFGSAFPIHRYDITEWMQYENRRSTAILSKKTIVSK